MNNSKEKLNDELLENVSGGCSPLDEFEKQARAKLEAAQASNQISAADARFMPPGSTPPDSPTIGPSLPF